MSMGKWWSSAGDGRWNILIRASLGFVFILEGYQKLAWVPDGSPRSAFLWLMSWRPSSA